MVKYYSVRTATCIWVRETGGSGGDPSNNAQNGNSLLGKMLRLNVNTLPYTIPSDNPYIADPNIADEIWAVGLRNPFRWSFDRANGDMWIADVGQGLRKKLITGLPLLPGRELRMALL